MTVSIDGHHTDCVMIAFADPSIAIAFAFTGMCTCSHLIRPASPARVWNDILSEVGLAVLRSPADQILQNDNQCQIGHYQS